uniref:Uncharacterized protein n=1 Tax=viral metagenome TaxID=1070528 RepID=A0A6C0EMK3_9ZZZZ
MRIDWQNPMIFSSVAGCVTSVVMIIILAVAKPDTVMKVGDDHTHSLDWLRVIMLSLILGLVVAIVLFVMKLRKYAIEQEPDKQHVADNY